MQSPSFPILDVQTLLQTSHPRRGKNTWLLYAVPTTAGFVLLADLSLTDQPDARSVIHLLGTLIMFGLVIAMITLTYIGLRQFRSEQSRLIAIEELMQLRRWPEAGAMIESLLSHPTRARENRVRGLVYLSSLLARYHRFADAITVHDYLLSHVHFDPATAFGLELNRAIALLREDRLLDADRALSRLRKLSHSEPAGAAGLALIEIFRDVKTGHPTEAIEIFDRRLPDIRQSLGHRAGDVYALIARAHDMLNHTDQAASAWLSATLLVPPAELLRRYPELSDLPLKYPPSPAPADALG